MASNSKFVLRCHIKDTIEFYAKRKAESEVVNEGGFKWKATFNTDWPEDFVDVMLSCDYEGHGEWGCQAKAQFLIRVQSNQFAQKRKTVSFDYGKRGAKFGPTKNLLHHLISLGFDDFNDIVIFEVHINIIKSKFPMNLALVNLFPNGMDNVTLVIGEKKVRVCKEYLAVHSPVLAVMFFGDFAEKGKEEIEIKDVIFEEFLDLLYLIYLGMMELTDYTVPHILKLADRFQMERVLIQTEKHLIKSERFDTEQKLIFSDKYRLTSLKDHCLKVLSNDSAVNEELAWLQLD